MPQIIHKLDSLTIDKIAAGEVIESPASCIKELVDNSIDAGARSIFVEIQVGGIELMLVRDDGKGMSAEDVLMSIERHATSKLKTIDDLERIHSRGFRGEALSSIASVSQMTIRSREYSATEASLPIGPGMEVRMEGGILQEARSVSSPFGTQVSVQSLFYNIPARRKFLKSPAKNSLEILKTLKQLALISPDIAFSLISDTTRVFDVPASQTLIDRIKTVLENPYAASSVPVQFEQEGISIHGLLALPECAKKNRLGQYIFVNARPVLSPMISYAVKAAYSTSILTDQHPQFVLALTLDPDRVDVNVHPQKKEVRFADEEWVRSRVCEAVSGALFASPFKPTFVAPLPWDQGEASASFSFDREPEVIREQVVLPFSWKKPEELQPIPMKTTVQLHMLFGHFALVSCEPFVYMVVDLKRALDSLVSASLQRKQIASSILLQPQILSLSPLERQCIEAKFAYLRSFGFAISLFGNDGLLLEGIPSFLELQEAQEVIRQFMEDELMDEERASESVCAKMASVAFSSAGKLSLNGLDRPFAEKILKQWVDVGAPPCTLKGKKVSVVLDPHSFETFFT